uniref:Uncharacterized protein n=1 Tax=Hucho hucho TaxID=62062 RepID=A0A4W5M9F1_9TELE
YYLSLSVGHDITSSLEPANIDTSILEDYIGKEDDSTDICFSEVHGGAPGSNSYSLTQAGVSSAGSLLCGVSSPISLRQGNPHPHQIPYPPPPPLGLLRHNNYPCLGQQHQQQNHIKPEHRGHYAPGTLPESPPDSSSEPYSPQQVNGKSEPSFAPDSPLPILSLSLSPLPFSSLSLSPLPILSLSLSPLPFSSLSLSLSPLPILSLSLSPLPFSCLKHKIVKNRKKDCQNESIEREREREREK